MALTFIRFDLTDHDQKKRLQLMDELFRQFGVTSAAAVLTLFFPPKLRPLLEAVTGSKKRMKRQFRGEFNGISTGLTSEFYIHLFHLEL